MLSMIVTRLIFHNQIHIICIRTYVEKMFPSLMLFQQQVVIVQYVTVTIKKYIQTLVESFNKEKQNARMLVYKLTY